MRHLPLSRSFLTVALVAIGLRAPVARAEEAPSKTYEEKNFRWSLPAGWTLEDAEAENKETGYVCIARKELSTSKGASAWALVVDAGGSSLDTLVAKATDNKKQRLNEPDASPAADTDWAGVIGARVVQINGKSRENGAAVQHRVYSAIVDGKLHQLDVKTWNGAEADLMTELETVAAGYRVLNGATAGDGSGQSGEVGDPRKARFDKLGLTWTLPVREGIRNFKFTGKAPADRVAPAAGSGSAQLAIAQMEGEGPSVEIELSVQIALPGGTSKGFINNEQNFTELVETNFQGTPVPNLDEEYKLGNWHGGMKSFTGKDKAGRPLMIRTIFAVLRENLYRVRVTAMDKGETTGALPITDALAGFKWDNPSEGVRGPVVSEFTAVTEPRPDNKFVGKDKVLPLLEGPFSVKKPQTMGELKYTATDSGFNTWLLALEGRKPGTYLFFGVKRYTDAMLRGSTPPLTADGLIDDIEGKWKNAVDEPKTQFTAGGNKTPDKFAGIKGQRYEFSGVYEGHPFIERGWLVMSGVNIMVIRMQYGGKGAEAAFAAETKTLMTSFKFK